MYLLLWALALSVAGILLGVFVELIALIAPFIRMVCLAVFILSLLSLPAAFIRKYRHYAGCGLIIASYAILLEAWIDCFVSAYAYFGKAAIIIGSLLFGVGVIPIGICAAVFNGRGFEALVLIITPIIAILVRMWGFRWLYRLQDQIVSPAINVSGPVYQNEEYYETDDMPVPTGTISKNGQQEFINNTIGAIDTKISVNKPQPSQ